MKQPNTARHATTAKTYRQLRDFNPFEKPGSHYGTDGSASRIKRSSSNGGTYSDKKRTMIESTPRSLAKKQSLTRNRGVGKAVSDSQKMFTFGIQQASIEYSKDAIPEKVEERDHSAVYGEEPPPERKPPQLLAVDSGIGLGLNSLFGSLKKSTFT